MHADQVKGRRALERYGLEGRKLRGIEASELAVLFLVKGLAGAAGTAKNKLEIRTDRGNFLAGEEIRDQYAAIATPHIDMRRPKSLVHRVPRCSNGAHYEVNSGFVRPFSSFSDGPLEPLWMQGVVRDEQ